MTLTEKNLWQSITAFALNDPASTLNFSERLSRENGWNENFTERVVEEYRRFIYLSCAGDTPATPSDAVDQAWHLHMVYTKNYWEDFCANTLGRMLHHHPTAGGPEEATKFNHQYQDTLQRYSEAFGEEAPADIWPAPQARFAANNFIRVNRTTHVVVSKKRIQNVGIALGTITFAAGAVIANPVVIIAGFLFGVVAMASLGGGTAGRQGNGSSSGGCGGGGCGAADTGCGSGCGGGCGGGD